MAITSEQKAQLENMKGFSELKAKYEKQMAGAGYKMSGRGFWEDIAKAIVSTAGSVNDFLKKNKVISKGAPIVGALLGQPVVGSVVAKTAEQYGYGKRGGSGLRANALTAGTSARKPPKKIKQEISNQMTLSQNGSFQRLPKLVGSGVRGGGKIIDVSPSTYNMISTNTKMSIKK